MKKIRYFAFVFVLFMLFSPVFSAVGTGECTVCGELRKKGFPEGYLDSLCALSLSHPQWSFDALDVTASSQLEGEAYTFSFVLEKETATPEQSLVSGDNMYAPYRDGAGERSDTGYYQASREAVAYFLDPRSFLSEKGIFQFLDLSAPSHTAPEEIAHIFEGSSLSGIIDPEWIVSLGDQYGVDSRFLAVRLRQEQGSEGNVLLTGTAGTMLLRWYAEGVDREGGKEVLAPSSGYDTSSLLSLDGYYNPFNASASGEGAFAVYHSGASHAKNMGWDTVEKGVSGGVEKIAKEYIASFQNTPYLQKWNVDIRSREENGESRNFWGQYMQNIGAAKTEGDRLYEAYEQMGWLEEKLSFLIPVYGGMPEKASSDPAGGKVKAFAAELCPVSAHRFQEETEVFVQEESPLKTHEKAALPEAVVTAPAQTDFEKNVFFLILFLLISFGILFLLFVFLTIFLPLLLQKKSNYWRK